MNCIKKANAPNKNTLYNMLCPKCESSEPFYIAISTVAKVYDSGTDELYDVEWADDSSCRCDNCNYEGVVKDFYMKKKPR